MSYEKLTERFETLHNLSHLGSIAYVDQAVNMPPGGNAARSKAMATLNKLKHEMFTSSEVGEWIEAAKSERLNDWESENLRLIDKSYKL